jgi:hypothetical protein
VKSMAPLQSVTSTITAVATADTPRAPSTLRAAAVTTVAHLAMAVAIFMDTVQRVAVSTMIVMIT